MNKPHKHIPNTQPTQSPSQQHQQQAEAIMQQLVSEGLFDSDEIAEITFSDSTILCIPETPDTDTSV